MMMKQYPLTAAQKMHDDWIKKYKTQQVSGVRAVSHCQILTQLSASSGLSTPSVAAALQTLWVSSRTTHVS